jgi:hypothetical protein
MTPSYPQSYYVTVEHLGTGTRYVQTVAAASAEDARHKALDDLRVRVVTVHGTLRPLPSTR